MSVTNPLRDLVRFGEESMPVIEEVLRDKYQKGYDTRMRGEPRVVAHSRRQGAWKRGWDDADEVLKKKNKEVKNDA